MLTSNATGGPRTLPLSGNGVDFALTFVRPARPTRSASNTAIISRVSPAAPSAVVDVVVSTSGAAALDGLPTAETRVELQCADVPRGLQCAVEPASVDLVREMTPVRVTLSTARQSGSMRLRSKSRRVAVGNYKLQLRAVSGAIVRAVDFSVAIK
jgi:hypothetical protein